MCEDEAMSAHPERTELLGHSVAVEELIEHLAELHKHLALALRRIEHLEAELEARSRAVREARPVQGIEQPQRTQRGPRDAKPLCAMSDDRWRLSSAVSH